MLDTISAIKIFTITRNDRSHSLFSLWEEIILSSPAKTFSISVKSQYIPSKYSHSLKRAKCLTHNLLVSKSGKTHSTPYPVEIFQARSLRAISITTPLSVSAFHTPSWCHISVPNEAMSCPSVVGIISKSISVVYVSLISCIFFSICIFSSLVSSETLSITGEWMGSKLSTSNQKDLKKIPNIIRIIYVLNIFFIVFYLW